MNTCLSRSMSYVIFGTCAYVLSCVQLFVTPWTVAQQVPLSMGFLKQENWSGLPFPSPRDLPDPGIKPACPALAGRFLCHLSYQGSPLIKPVFNILRISEFAPPFDSNPEKSVQLIDVTPRVVEPRKLSACALPTGLYSVLTTTHRHGYFHLRFPH